MTRSPALTLETAKAYVRDYCAREGITCDIEGCGMFSLQGTPIVRLNVTQDGACAVWDVWSEPLHGGALYGEF